LIIACGNSEQGGVVDDGIQAFDSNGALKDSTSHKSWDPSIDTAKGNDRVDIQQRDSAYLF
jgi:hypothetical protein